MKNQNRLSCWLAPSCWPFWDSCMWEAFLGSEVDFLTSFFTLYNPSTTPISPGLGCFLLVCLSPLTIKLLVAPLQAALCILFWVWQGNMVSFGLFFCVPSRVWPLLPYRLFYFSCRNMALHLVLVYRSSNCSGSTSRPHLVIVLASVAFTACPLLCALSLQRVLGAKTLLQGQIGCVLAGFLKISPLFLMVLPGLISRACESAMSPSWKCSLQSVGATVANSLCVFSPTAFQCIQKRWLGTPTRLSPSCVSTFCHQDCWDSWLPPCLRPS